jgi:hypothetical protein
MTGSVVFVEVVAVERGRRGRLMQCAARTRWCVGNSVTLRRVVEGVLEGVLE